MLKKATFAPTHPTRAETRVFVGCVLLSRKSSTYRTRVGAVLAARGGSVKHGDASGFFSAAALLGKGRVQGKELVLAGSGRKGQMARLGKAGVIHRLFEHRL